MSIDFAAFPPEELMLLSALEGMCGQYGIQPSARSAAEKAEAVLAAYGLVLDGPDYETTTFADLERAVSPHKDRVGYWKSGFEWKADQKKLSRRSEALLVLLAGMSYGILGKKAGESEYLHHMHMSAGEAACFQLIAYSLLVEAPGGGRCNDKGRQAADLAMSDAFQPLDDATFEDIL